MNTFNLDAFFPEKVLVSTSIGDIYVGGHNYDRAAFKLSNNLEVGERIVKDLCSTAEDKTDKTPLADELFANLKPEDIEVIGPVMAQLQRWQPVEPPKTFEEIAASARTAHERDKQHLKAELEKWNKPSLQKKFNFLDESTVARLSKDLSGLGELQKAAESINVGLAFKSGLIGEAIKGLTAKSNAQVLSAKPSTGFQPPLDRLRELPKIPRPEETPIGKATLESARQIEAMTQLMSQLTAHMASLQETVVGQVLPQWFQKVKADQEQSEENSRQAKESAKSAQASLRVAVWTLGLSIVVTVGTAWWQIYAAKKLDTENSKQETNLRKEDIARDAERHKDLMKVLNELIAVSKKNAEEKKSSSDKPINQR